jgi:hypothetical protein
MPFTPFEQVKRTWSFFARYSVKDSNYRYHTDSNWSHGGNSSHYILDTATVAALAREQNIDYAVQQAAANIYSSGWDALTFLAELRKTATSFATIQDRLASMLKRARTRANRRGVKLLLDDAASLWLESRYQWRTLLYDIEDFALTLAEFDEKRKRFSERSGWSTQTSDSYTYDTSDVNQWWTTLVDTTYDISVRGSVVADIQPPKFGGNPVTTGWELVRFSFIVDWIINVGNWLESLSFLAMQSAYTAAGGVHISATRETAIETSGLSNPGLNSLDIEFNSHCKVEYTLRVPTSISLKPQSKIRLNVPKVVDLWALIYRAIRRG